MGLGVVKKDTSFPRVEIVLSYIGMERDMVQRCIDSEVDGIILVAFGAGNIDKNIRDCIKIAIDSKIRVVITSRINGGICTPKYNYIGGGKELLSIGAESSNLAPHKARIALIFDILKNRFCPDSLQILP